MAWCEDEILTILHISRILFQVDTCQSFTCSILTFQSDTLRFSVNDTFLPISIEMSISKWFTGPEEVHKNDQSVGAPPLY